MASIPHRGRVPFVGRREELQRLLQLRARLEGNGDHRRHLVLVEGFSGVGKSALAEEFLNTLERDERTFTPRGAYSPHLHRSSLAPVLDAVDDLFAGRFAQRRLQAFFADVTYYPLLASLPVLRNSIGLDSLALKQGTVSASTLAALIGSVLTHAARFRPVVMLIDDIQFMPWEDLEALMALNAGLRNAPVLLLATMRREGDEAEKIRTTLGPILLDHFHLAPLPTKEVAELVTEVYGARVSAQIAADIAHAGEGIPLRTMELIRRLEEQSQIVLNHGEWRLSSNYNQQVLAHDGGSIDKVRRLDPMERRMLLLLGCAGGRAGRDELVQWLDGMKGICDDAASDGVAGSSQSPAGALEVLEQGLFIKPLMANPDRVTFVHESISDAVRQLRTRQDLECVARMIAGRSDLRATLRVWAADAELFGVLLGMLPPVGSPERQEIMDVLISRHGHAKWGHEPRAKVYAIMAAHRHLLTPREYAEVLVRSIPIEHYFARFPEATARAEELYALTEQEPSCHDLRAESCGLLAFARFYNDRSIDISGLLQEASQTLGRIADNQQRLRTELQVARMRTALVPVGEPQEAINRARRVLQLADTLGMEDERYNVLPELVVRSARLRDEEGLRSYCNDLLKSIRESASSGAKLPPFHVVSGVVRATLIYGDIFLARQIFESWSRCSAPIEIADYIAYSYLTTLFAIADGEPGLAADTAMSAREEVLRHRAASRPFSWELTFNYAILQVQLVPSLIAAGRFFDALLMSETMIEEMAPFESRLPDMVTVLRLYTIWLRWRCKLPVDAPVALCWPSAQGGMETMGGRGDRRTADGIVADDPESVRKAADEFRAFHATITGKVAPPPRFIAETLLAALESAERNYPAALEALGRAAIACDQLYDWQRELEHRASTIAVKLRWAESGAPNGAELAEEALESARDLFATMSEKGLVTRVAQLAGIFRDMAAGITHRDLPAQFDRMGASAQAAAHVVVRNSRSEESGPIERARLFVMGPFRLMRPHSYMELSETAFGRETARTLLVSLVAAEVLERTWTREELAAQIVPKARTPEQQKKALYNAASAARSACLSPNSILNVGANSLELNTNADMEGSVWVDALEIKRAVRKGSELDRAGETGPAFDQYQRALLLARKGEFATDIYADWVDAARDRLREDIRQAALAVARMTLRNGLYAIGIEAITTQLTRDQFDEEAHRALIRLYAESGNRSGALKQFEKCRKLIKREFGVEPESETLRLKQEIIGVTEPEGALGERR